MDTDLFRGPNKRPRPTSMGNAVLPSLKRAKGSATHTPQSPASTAVPGDIEAGPSTQPWYRNPKRKAHARAPHGYQLKELMVVRPQPAPLPSQIGIHHLWRLFQISQTATNLLLAARWGDPPLRECCFLAIRLARRSRNGRIKMGRDGGGICICFFPHR